MKRQTDTIVDKICQLASPVQVAGAKPPQPFAGTRIAECTLNILVSFILLGLEVVNRIFVRISLIIRNIIFCENQPRVWLFENLLLSLF